MVVVVRRNRVFLCLFLVVSFIRFFIAVIIIIIIIIRSICTERKPCNIEGPE